MKYRESRLGKSQVKGDLLVSGVQQVYPEIKELKEKLAHKVIPKLTIIRTKILNYLFLRF